MTPHPLRSHRSRAAGASGIALLVAACSLGTDASPYVPIELGGRWTGAAEGLRLDLTLETAACDWTCGGRLSGTYAYTPAALTDSVYGAYWIARDRSGGGQERVEFYLQERTFPARVTLAFAGSTRGDTALVGTVTDRQQPSTLETTAIAMTLRLQ